MSPGRQLLALAALLAPVAASAQQRSVVTGTVFSAVSGDGLPYSTISVDGAQRFSGADGSFALELPAGRHSIRVRQLGYAPLDTTLIVGAADLRGVAFALQPVAIRLDTIRTVATVCKADEQVGELSPLLEELKKNSERERLLRTEYPFVYQLERRNAFQGIGGVSERDVDTVKYFSKVVGGYSPGNLVRPIDPDAPNGTREMRIPTLVDLADPAFIRSHCFTFRGVEDVGGARAYRIDFDPVRDLTATDVAGSAYIDTATFAIREATFRLTKPEKLKPPVIDLQVTTTYREIFKGLNLFFRVHSEQAMAQSPRFNSVQLQDQKLIAVVFYARAPDDVVAAVAGVTPPSAKPVIDSAARLAGVVVDSAGHPLAGAEIIAPDGGARTTATDSGRFVIRGLKPGKTSFLVRAFGFAPASFTSELRPMRTRSVRVVLTRVTVQLSTIVVEEEINDKQLALSGFYDRRKSGFGTFITPEDIQAMDEAHVADILRGVRGVDIQPGGTWGTVPYSRRDPGTFHGRCGMNVFVDGVAVTVNRDFPLETAIQGSELAAIEVYVGPSETPAKYLGASNGCGSIVIWSKGYLRNAPRKPKTNPGVK